MSFSRAEIFESLAEDIGTGFRPGAQFRRRDNFQPDGFSFVRRTGRGEIDFTPPWRTRGRGTAERKKLGKSTRTLFAEALEIEAARLGSPERR